MVISKNGGWDGDGRGSALQGQAAAGRLCHLQPAVRPAVLGRGAGDGRGAGVLQGVFFFCFSLWTGATSEEIDQPHWQARRKESFDYVGLVRRPASSSVFIDDYDGDDPRAVVHAGVLRILWSVRTYVHIILSPMSLLSLSLSLQKPAA
jgi:hypothetical protein